jgi:hypothetical protein
MSQKSKRSSKPRSIVKQDEYGNRIWKAMLFKHKGNPVALGSLIASINSTVDKTNYAIFRPMTLTQKAICDLPHQTGYELLYILGFESQNDLKMMSCYLMIVLDRYGRVL